MTDGIASLVTDSGKRLALKKRTATIIDEIYARQSQIESLKKGRVEMAFDCANNSVTVSVREVGESRRVE